MDNFDGLQYDYDSPDLEGSDSDKLGDDRYEPYTTNSSSSESEPEDPWQEHDIEGGDEEDEDEDEELVPNPAAEEEVVPIPPAEEGVVPVPAVEEKALPVAFEEYLAYISPRPLVVYMDNGETQPNIYNDLLKNRFGIIKVDNMHYPHFSLSHDITEVPTFVLFEDKTMIQPFGVHLTARLLADAIRKRSAKAVKTEEQGKDKRQKRSHSA